MSITQSVAHILRERVTLEVESIDRLYLNVYVPKLQRVGGVVGFFRERGATFASSALMEPLTTAFVKALERFAQTEGVPLLPFAHGQRKDEIAQEYLAAFAGHEGVLFIGKAQEKATVWRTERRYNRADRAALCLAGQVHRAGQSVLHLRRRRRLWPLLPQVLLVLPLQRQTVPQWARVPQAVPLGPAEMDERPSVGTPQPSHETATRRVPCQTKGLIGPKQSSYPMIFRPKCTISARPNGTCQAIPAGVLWGWPG